MFEEWKSIKYNKSIVIYFALSIEESISAIYDLFHFSSSKTSILYYFQRLVQETKITSELLSFFTPSNEIIELASKLKTLKVKYEMELEGLQGELYQNHMILSQTQTRVDYLNFEKEWHTQMIKDINKLLGDVRNQMQEDLNKVKAICEDIPYLIGLAALGV